MLALIVSVPSSGGEPLRCIAELAARIPAIDFIPELARKV